MSPASETTQGFSMKITLKGLSLAIASVGMLTIYGCGGGGGSDPLPTSTSVTVTPSLGRFSERTPVKLKKPDGTELASGSLDANGKHTFSLTGYAGPVVVEVLGGADVTYYDERTKGLAAFAAGKTLRAVMPALQAEVGVTALTNAAAAQLEDPVLGFKNALATTINGANAKVAAVFGLPDILVAPKTVDGTTAATLNVATPGDKYALVLAALAKTATGTNAAADVADALASDLKDDKLDGVDSTSSTPTAPIANAPAPATMTTKYEEAATELADETSQSFIKQQPLAVVADVSKITAVTNQSDVNLAKAMFAELRTTLNSFSNGSTGFLDTQATRINADLNANVTPELSKVASRISTLGMAMSMFEDGKAYTSSNTFGLVAGTAPNNGPAALVRENGSLQAVWNGYGSYDYCWTDSATGVTSKVSCSHAGTDSADWANNRIKFVVYELTSPATNQFSYTATRYNRSVTLLNGLINALGTPTLPMVPTGSGTLTKTVSGTTMTGLTINGTLTPSASSATGTLVTGVDTIAIFAARTALTAANNFHYALSGSVSTTNLADATKVVTLSLDSGSFIDLDEATAATTGAKPVAMKLIGTAQTTATKFTGTLDAGSFMNDADGKNNSPTSVVFNGSISDTSGGGAGQMLTGKLEAAMANYSQYHSTQPDSATNFMKPTVTFTGTVQAPSRPLLKLVVAAVKTGVSTSNITVDYSYGIVKITGSGATTEAGSTLTLSNQDGVQVVLNSGTNTGTVTKSGATLATLGNGSVNYADGVTESLN
jgi:hypothetical protein